MLQEAALTAFAAVQNHCETRLEKYFAILTFDDSEVAVTQHGLLLEAQLSFHQGLSQPELCAGAVTGSSECVCEACHTLSIALHTKEIQKHEVCGGF